MKVLITGGAGYLGSTLTSMLLNIGHEVVVYDSLLYNKDCLLPLFRHKHFKFVEGDVRERQTLRPYLDDVDFIFPLAAIVGAPACQKKQLEATQVNLQAIEFIAQNTEANIIFPNTNSGYGTSEEICTELSPFNPLSHYATTKTKAERYLQSHTDAIILRLATVFGVSLRTRTDLLVNDFTLRAAKDGYIVLFEEYAKRNYIYIQDVARLFLFFMNNFSAYSGEIFNAGLPQVLSKLDLAHLIAKHIPFSIQIDKLAKDPDKRNYQVSSDKLLKTGWEFHYNVEDGIKEILRAVPLLLKNSWNNI